MNASDPPDVWRTYSNQFRKYGAPLRPSAQDAELMAAAVLPALASTTRPAMVAILGVTPEIVSLPWPDHVRLHAFDQSADMIAAVWRPHPTLRSDVTQAYWQNLPLPHQSVRIVVGDGSLNALPGLSQYPHVLSELARVLEMDGIVGVRCYIRPDTIESANDVVAAALAGKIQSFHALKWRIAMISSHPPDHSVAVVDILAAFEALFPNRRVLADAANWPMEVVDTIDAYRGASARYNFPTLSAFREACAPWFEVDNITRGDYEMAERFPTIRLRRVFQVARGKQ